MTTTIPRWRSEVATMVADLRPESFEIAADFLTENRGLWETEECGCDHGSIDSGGVTPWGVSISIVCPDCDGKAFISHVADPYWTTPPCEMLTIARLLRMFDERWHGMEKTAGCHKDFCLGTDIRWPRCPNCGSEWSKDEQSRVKPTFTLLLDRPGEEKCEACKGEKHESKSSEKTRDVERHEPPDRDRSASIKRGKMPSEVAAARRESVGGRQRQRLAKYR